MPSDSSHPPQIVGQPFRLAGWLVDPVACRLERDGEAVRVEPKVMEVLAYLAGRPGQVVSREELEDSVWTGTVVGYEAVTNAVIKLRKALRDDARDPRIIETVSKRGYRLIAEITPAEFEAVGERSPDDSGERFEIDHAHKHRGLQPQAALYRSRNRILALAAIALIAGIGVLTWWRSWAPEFPPASVANMAYPLPEKPSIAVLPFDTFSGGEDDQLVALGVTEDIITALSNIPEFFVISRVSSFTFKSKSVTVREVAEALGVRYILEGSIQRSGENLRITAQLIDAIAGHHLWADHFDGRAEDLFALQDDIVRRILVELRVQLTVGDHARTSVRGTTNLKAWELSIRASTEARKFTKEGVNRARELSTAAHELDPDWARPVASLAFCHWWEARNGWSADREASIRKGVELAEKAIAMNPNDTLGYMYLGNLRQLQGEHDQAVALREKAVALAPNDFQTTWGLGAVLFKAGQPERAIEILIRAQRLSPRHPAALLWSMAMAQLVAGRYEEAVETGKRAIVRTPNHAYPRFTQAAAYAALGRTDEAKAEAAELLRIDPSFTVSRWKPSQPFKDPAIVDRWGDLLVKAGLPE